MEKLKFALFAIVVLGLLGLLGYWAITTLQSGTESKMSEQKTKNDLSALQAKLPASAPIETSAPKKPELVTYKYQSLIGELQKLIDNRVVLKLKSRGANVGTVQRFLNIYNNTSARPVRVDNDYGAGTVKLVTTFQKAEGLTANGEAGPETFNKMIDWLKKQN
ncbi:MAG: Peptidoglycan binding domain-containing protein [Parcubacteria group bacterium GW2011_GWB1_41_5]|nr:MAG: Peptidoglycan binding domain-containing protein [Parcubacteria group bacterium GW2011_GWB1_41_5]